MSNLHDASSAMAHVVDGMLPVESGNRRLKGMLRLNEYLDLVAVRQTVLGKKLFVCNGEDLGCTEAEHKAGVSNEPSTQAPQPRAAWQEQWQGGGSPCNP